jgi:hypothetical protein
VRVFKVRDQGGVPCREVRALGAAKLAMVEARVAELCRARDRLRGVLSLWDEILARTPRGARAALLDALEGLVEPGAPSPLVPPPLRRGGRAR